MRKKKGGSTCGAFCGTKLGSSCCRASTRTFVTVTPISEAPNPTPSSLAPLRATAPARWATLKGE
jgi:hypothetical protein